MSSLLNLLVVGGGAGGGSTGGGGGGAGQVVSKTLVVTAPVSVTIGAGGTGTSGDGVSGGNTIFGSTLAQGGGGGGQGGGTPHAGVAGACGGGGGGYSGGNSESGGTGSPGYNGGASSGTGPAYGGGGGGGNGAGGSPGTGISGGNGGAGVANSITGASVYYGGGGGGGAGSGSANSSGGSSIGGDGSDTTTGGNASSYGSGGGGGAYNGGGYNGGNGSDGVVILSFPTGTATASYTGSSSSASDGSGNTVYTLTTSGTFTLTPIGPTVNPSLCARKCSLTIDHTAVAESATYAVLFDGSGDTSSFGTRLPDELFTLSQSDGGDICFTDVNGTQLPVELVSIDVTNKKAEIWVAAALSASVDTVIYVYYKSKTGTLIQPTANGSYGSEAVWNGSGSVGGAGNYMALVSHDGGLTDSTGNYAPVNGGTLPATSGQIGDATNLNGGSITLTPSGNIITPSTGVTVQLWTDYTSITDYAGLFQLSSSLGSLIWAVGKNGNSGLGGYDYYLGFRGSNQIVSSTAALDFDSNQNSWHLLDIAYNGGGGGTNTVGSYSVQADGSAVTISNIGSTIGNDAHSTTNYLGSQGAGDSLPGNSDEFRVTNTARSANYRLTDYHIQSSTSLVTVGTPAANTAPGIHIVSAVDTVAATDSASKHLATHYLSVFDLISATHTATCHDNRHSLSNTDGITVTDSAAVYVSTHHVAATDLISVQNRAFNHDTITRQAVTEQITVTDSATVRMSVVILTAADVLSIVDVAKGNVPGTTYASASNIIQIMDTSVEIGPIYLSAVDLIAPIAYTNPIVSFTTQLVGLQDAATVSKKGTESNSDTLSLGDLASCGKIRADAIAISASDTLTLTDKAIKSTTAEAADTVVLGDMALVEVGYPAADMLSVGDTARANVVRNLQAQDVLIVEQSITYLLPYYLAKRYYSPFIGTGTSGNPAPPPTTLAQNLKSGEFSLYYPPAPFVPADIVVLRKPEFGNKDRLHFNRISRETRGGTLIVFADPMWPKTQTLVLTFAALRPDQAFNLQRFMETYLGLEIGLMDWEGRQWTGVIVNPNDPVVQDSKYSYTASFEFEGQLVSELTGQTV